MLVAWANHESFGKTGGATKVTPVGIMVRVLGDGTGELDGSLAKSNLPGIGLVSIDTSQGALKEFGEGVTEICP